LAKVKKTLLLSKKSYDTSCWLDRWA
jgi:hypothetical protein